jgi:hypothetical protein
MDIEMYIRDESIKFSSFHPILERLPEFKQFLREIKLNTLLEGKKVQFDIDEIKSTTQYMGKYIVNTDTESLLDISSLSSSYDLRIDSMSFIIENDNVVSIKSKISILSHELLHLINNGLKVELHPLIVNEKVSKFYLIKV